MQTVSLYVEKLSYRARSSFRIEDLSFIVKQGQCLVLTGANGTGKSTMLHILAGLIRPCQGRICLQGHDIHRFGEAAKKHLGLLPEKLNLHPALRVKEYLNFVSSLYGISKSARIEAVDRALDDLRLQPYASVPIHQLSRGLMQSVGLAQAILHRPAVLLLDEPTNGLDPNEVHHFQSLLTRLKPQTAIVLSTHHFNEVQDLCDQRLRFSHQGIQHDLYACTA